jgi:hypothetical protein
MWMKDDYERLIVKKDEKHGHDMFTELFQHSSAGTEGNLGNLYWRSLFLELLINNWMLDLIDKDNSAATQMRYLAVM